MIKQIIYTTMSPFEILQEEEKLIKVLINFSIFFAGIADSASESEKERAKIDQLETELILLRQKMSLLEAQEALGNMPQVLIP